MSLHYLFFDFGGCIDSPGIHTRTLFFREFVARGIVRAEERAIFQEAYTTADKKFMKEGSAKDLGLEEFNRLQARIMCEALRGSSGGQDVCAADAVTAFQAECLRHNHGVLQALAQEFPLGIISNFTGNLEVILREFELRDFFQQVTESFYVGAAKPDKKIFLQALGRQGSPPENCLFVGDNPVNDMAPAQSLGMKTALIHAPGERRDCGADYYISDLSELAGVIRS